MAKDNSALTIKFILFHLVNKFHVAYTILIRPVFNLQTKGITYDIVPEEMCWYEVVLYTLMKPAVFITCHAYNVSNANFWNVFDLVMYVKTVSLSVKQQQLDTVKFLWYLDCFSIYMYLLMRYPLDLILISNINDKQYTAWSNSF